jgi:hypothetical protein
MNSEYKNRLTFCSFKATFMSNGNNFKNNAGIHCQGWEKSFQGMV